MASTYEKSEIVTHPARLLRQESVLYTIKFLASFLWWAEGKIKGAIMAPKNNNKPWTSSQESQLRSLARQNTPTRVIGLKLGRTPDAVQSRASQIGVSLKPTNQSPYNRSK